MPRKIPAKSKLVINYEHWYNFLVPLTKRNSFYERLPEELKFSDGIYEREESRNLVIDLVFVSKDRRTPLYIQKLFNDFSGVDVYDIRNR